jgi:hypothetical protein
MTELEFIGKQQLKIEEMRALLTQSAAAFESIRGTIYCIGGPLNDNKLRYTREQMGDFGRIAGQCLELNDYLPGGALAATP